jgi:hypothetical protein
MIIPQKTGVFMNNQTVDRQTQESNRVVYVKPTLETHPKYTTMVGVIGGSTMGIIPIQPLDLISNPGLELIPDPVDLDI